MGRPPQDCPPLKRRACRRFENDYCSTPRRQRRDGVKEEQSGTAPPPPPPPPPPPAAPPDAAAAAVAAAGACSSYLLLLVRVLRRMLYSIASTDSTVSAAPGFLTWCRAMEAQTSGMDLLICLTTIAPKSEATRTRCGSGILATLAG